MTNSPDMTFGSSKFPNKTIIYRGAARAGAIWREEAGYRVEVDDAPEGTYATLDDAKQAARDS